MVLTRSAETETSLVQQAQHGDRNAYGELVRRHYSGVVTVVQRMCGDARLAEDAAQEAFLRAWLKLPSYQPRTSLRNWLYRIAVNAALDVLRHKPDEPLEKAAGLGLASQAADPESTLVEKEQVEMLQDAVRSLPDASRSVLVLREYSGLSYEEIASVLEVPVGTVMSRLNYARSRLREILKDSLVPEENEYA